MTKVTTMSTMQKSLGLRQATARLDKEYSQKQNELVTGLKADVYADSQLRAAQSLDLRNRLDRVQAFQTSNKLLSGKMSMMSQQLEQIRTRTSEMMSSSLSLKGTELGRATLEGDAKALISMISGQLNTAYGGEFLFSGLATSEAAIRQNAVMTGHSGLTTGADATDVAAGIARIDAWFGLDGGTEPAGGYSDSVYGGSTDGIQKASLDETRTISYGVRGDDQAMREIFKGLSMLADPLMNSFTDEAARSTWIQEATGALARGVEALQLHEAQLGHQQAQIERVGQEQESLQVLYNARVTDIEGVDAYEAASMMEALGTQLEASYQVTVKLQRLSLLNYM